LVSCACLVVPPTKPLRRGGFVEPAPELAADTRASWWRLGRGGMSYDAYDFPPDSRAPTRGRVRARAARHRGGKPMTATVTPAAPDGVSVEARVLPSPMRDRVVWLWAAASFAAFVGDSIWLVGLAWAAVATPLFGWLAATTSVTTTAAVFGACMVVAGAWGAARPVIRAVG
jgi:hypothetical protein